MEFTKRQLLSATAATASAGVIAGCTGGEPAAGSKPDETTAQASFFVFGDLTEKVTGDTASAELLVPIGQHGHGWEPGPSIRKDIRDADLLVHGMTGFQPWVDSINTDLEVDDPDLTAIDVSAGLELLEAGEYDDHDDYDDGDSRERFDDDHDDSEADHESEDADESHEHDHDHDSDSREDFESGMDPHFWMDPLRVEQATATIRQGLANVDPDNADVYADNAETFRTELEELHLQIDELVDAASEDVLLVAGHNSLQYFGDRYGVAVESLTGVSPDDSPTPQDIEQAQRIIESQNLQYICADPLESQRAADQLVQETAAEEVLPLTAMPGLAETWESENWGYIGVMENVNVPTLERALNV